jgi:NAD(P)-dependent dehydrogenase (short-subunit alcohol dehydrogenase family)
MRFRLDGRKALVTGASSGLGRHFAHVLAGAGATVVVAARRTDRLAELVDEIRNNGGLAHAVALDVSDEASVRQCLDEAAAAAGTIDILVNNAGVTATAPVLKFGASEWDAIIDTNLRGSFLLAQETARRMVQADTGGSIINIASILGERVAGGLTAYCTSKAGLIQLTKSMALDLARYRIRVNALAPGYIATDLNGDFLASEAGQKLMSRIPQRRFGKAENLDGPLLLLASEAGEYMTGAVIAVDGGHLVSSL